MSPAATPVTAPEAQTTTPPLVSLNNGELTIHAHDTTLGEILEAITSLTGIAADIPQSGADQRIFDQVGPAPVRETLVKLLDGTSLNYVIVSSAQDPQVVKRLILTAQPSGSQPVLQASAAEPDEQNGPVLYGAGYSNDGAAAQTPEPAPPVAAPANGIPTNANVQQMAAAENKTPGQVLDELQKRQIKMLEDQAAQAAQNAPPQ